VTGWTFLSAVIIVDWKPKAKGGCFSMKTRIWQNVLAATLLALTPTASRAAEADDSKSDKNSATAPSAPAVVGAPTNAPAPGVVAATNAEPVTVLQLPKPGLPPLLDQVVRLNQSGADESVVRAYIEKAAPPYQITGNEIIQLQDLGVSKPVILALIEHSKSATSGESTSFVATAPAPAPSPSEPQTNTEATDTAPSEGVEDYRDALSPYGAWLDVPGYGWCWQPTVVVVNPGWRPYSDNGDWLWTDSGWYWHSYYSWGWAPFHYGRWWCHPRSGWLWCPDRVWGPAWVCWRNSASHCGWAALPPRAHFSAGLGWTFHGGRVGFGFDFGLPAAHFTFVSHSRFADHHVARHSLRGNDVHSVYRNTTVVNSYAMGANNRVINHGVGRATIAAASQTPIREASINNLTPTASRFAGANQANRSANIIQRSSAQSSASRNGAGASASTFARQGTPQRPVASNPSSAPRNGMGASIVRQGTAQQRVASNPTATMRGSSRAGIAGGNATQRTMPNYSRNYANAPSAQPHRGGNAFAGRVAPSYQAPRYSAPAVRSQAAPRSFAPSVRSVPRSSGSFSGGGMSSRGSGGGLVSRGMSGHSFGARR
jgi:hypothetical protein